MFNLQRKTTTRIFSIFLTFCCCPVLVVIVVVGVNCFLFEKLINKRYLCHIIHLSNVIYFSHQMRHWYQCPFFWALFSLFHTLLLHTTRFHHIISFVSFFFVRVCVDINSFFLIGYYKAGRMWYMWYEFHDHWKWSWREYGDRLGEYERKREWKRDSNKPQLNKRCNSTTTTTTKYNSK